MKSIVVINICEDFSEYPGGRYCKHGKFSGEVLRDDLLYPTLMSNNVVIVNLNGVLGFGSSFLEEAFGGLVRVHGMSADDLTDRLGISGGLNSDRVLIRQFIAEAEASEKARELCSEGSKGSPIFGGA